jgi:hypothetical protein
MPTASLASSRRFREPAFWAVLALLLVALKAALLVADPTIRLFLGDSESYLHAALTFRILPDRSYLYGVLIRWIAVATGSLHALAIAQTLAGIASGLLVAWMLRAIFAVRRTFVAAAAIAVCVEPAQLFYERMVMAESFCTTCLLAMLACGLGYVRWPRWPWLLAVAWFGICAVALRVSMLPVVLGFALLPPLVALVAGGMTQSRRRAWAHVGLALLATLAAHTLYRREYGLRAKGPPDYLAASGLLRLGLVAPLLTAEHFAAEGLPPEVLREVGPPLRNHRSREEQLWNEDGLIQVLIRARGREADPIARRLAWRAVRDDRLGLLRLGWRTSLDHFDPEWCEFCMTRDLGTRDLDPETLAMLRDQFAYDARGVHARRNPVARYFGAAGGWLTLCLFALPLVAAGAARAHWRRARAESLLFGLFALGMFAAHVVFAHIVCFRYLHPFAVVFLLGLGVLAAGWSRVRNPGA